MGPQNTLDLLFGSHKFQYKQFFLFPKILGKGGLPVVWKAALTVIEITRVIVADTRVYSKLEYLKIASLYSSIIAILLYTFLSFRNWWNLSKKVSYAQTSAGDTYFSKAYPQNFILI